MTYDKNEGIRKFVLFTILIFIYPCKIIIQDINKIIGKGFTLSNMRSIIRMPMQQIMNYSIPS
jgi:hypothetical protein